jgi:hypothetical protein
LDFTGFHGCFLIKTMPPRAIPGWSNEVVASVFILGKQGMDTTSQRMVTIRLSDLKAG